MRAGYLRKNGVPYSENAVLTEYFVRTTAPNGDEWLVVTSIVDDPTYLNEPFVTSYAFQEGAERLEVRSSPACHRNHEGEMNYSHAAARTWPRRRPAPGTRTGPPFETDQRRKSTVTGPTSSTKTCGTAALVFWLATSRGCRSTTPASWRAASWDPGWFAIPEEQCRPHTGIYGLRGPTGLQIAKVVDPQT